MLEELHRFSVKPRYCAAADVFALSGEVILKTDPKGEKLYFPLETANCSSTPGA